MDYGMEPISIGFFLSAQIDIDSTRLIGQASCWEFF
jgi:hypothetical protein